MVTAIASHPRYEGMNVNRAEPDAAPRSNGQKDNQPVRGLLRART